MAEFASNGKGNAALTTGIIGTALSGLLAAGTGILGGAKLARGEESWCNEDHLINRYNMEQEKEIVQLKMDKAILISDSNTNKKIADTYEKINDRIERLYKDLDGKIVVNENKTQAMFTEQAVYNAANNATIGCIRNQVDGLYGMTKLIIPHSSVCPQPMPLYNSWKDPSEE